LPEPLLPLEFVETLLPESEAQVPQPIDPSKPAEIPASSKSQTAQTTAGKILGSKASAPVSTKKEGDAPRSFRSLQTVPLRKKTESVVEEAPKVEEIIAVNQPFTTEALLRAWNIFIETIQDDPHLVNAMKSCPPTLLEDYKIEILVQNQPLEKKMQDLKISIENHLHHLLKNNRIKLVIRLTEENEQVRPFTSKDKLESMIKKNPNLELLYRTLGMEI
jgi:hypothetical protein